MSEIINFINFRRLRLEGAPPTAAGLSQSHVSQLSVGRLCRFADACIEPIRTLSRVGGNPALYAVYSQFSAMADVFVTELEARSPATGYEQRLRQRTLRAAEAAHIGLRGYPKGGNSEAA
jgi:hypothetical protein